MEFVLGNIIQHAGMGTGRVSGQDVNVNPELNELLKYLRVRVLLAFLAFLDFAI